jgi:hypothetical protein
MSKSSRLALLGLAGLLLAIAVPAFADDPASRGIEFYKHHQYEEARQAFEEAYSTQHSTSALLGLAMAELQSNHVLDATRHLRQYLRAPDAPADKLESVRSKWLPQAESQIGRLAIDAPAGAQLVLDGFNQGDNPFPASIDVAPGDHEVEVKLGAWSRSVHVNALRGAIVSVKIDREPEAAPSPPPPAPPPAPDVVSAPAAHRQPSTAKIVTVAIVGGAAVIATGLAVGFAVGSHNEANQANTLRSGLSSSACSGQQQPLPPTCPELAAATSAQGRDYNLATDLYVTGGVLAGAAVATWLLWPNTWGLRPTFDGHTAGAIMERSF